MDMSVQDLNANDVPTLARSSGDFEAACREDPLRGLRSFCCPVLVASAVPDENSNELSGARWRDPAQLGHRDRGMPAVPPPAYRHLDRADQLRYDCADAELEEVRVGSGKDATLLRVCLRSSQ